LASPVDTSVLSRVLGVMSRHDDWSAISAAVSALSDYLADTDTPIDYHRRRQMNYSTLLPDTEWIRICRDNRYARKIRCSRSHRPGLPL